MLINIYVYFIKLKQIKCNYYITPLQEPATEDINSFLRFYSKNGIPFIITRFGLH